MEDPFDLILPNSDTGDWFGATDALTLTDRSAERESSTLHEAEVVLPHR